MLPIILILLFATSALAVPTVQLNLNSIDETGLRPSNGRPIGAYVVLNALDTIDGGEKNVHTQYLLSIVGDLANSSNSISQARALAEAVAILIELSTGYPGNSCAAANFINAFVNAIRSGNDRDARAVAASYVRDLASGLNYVHQLTLNPVAARFAIGRRGNCQDGGASYQFEAAWDLVRSSAASPDLIQEQYCAVKRLYNGFTAISRNVGAAATAAAQSYVAEIFNVVRYKVADCLVAVAYGRPNAGQAIRDAQHALISAANNFI